MKKSICKYRLLSQICFGLVSYIPLLVLLVIISYPGDLLGINIYECLKDIPSCLFYAGLSILLHVFANYSIIPFLFIIVFFIIFLASIAMIGKRKYVLINSITLICSIFFLTCFLFFLVNSFSHPVPP